ncbi:MAG: hypothetical protein WCK34_06645 [Bacteroidota bacterium]
MTEKNIQEQISELNHKLDLILESVELQKRNREEFDDLVSDLSIVARDAFKETVVMLDKSQVDFDQSGVPMLLIRILQNIGTFREMLEMVESARDFMKDISPVLHQVGLDAVNKMNELDQKGYFVFANGMMKFLDKFIQDFTADDMRNLQANLENIVGIMRNLTQPELITAINRTTKAISEVKMDDKLDNRSLFGILKQMNSPEVRKSLSYALRLVQAINREN